MATSPHSHPQTRLHSTSSTRGLPEQASSQPSIYSNYGAGEPLETQRMSQYILSPVPTGRPEIPSNSSTVYRADATYAGHSTTSRAGSTPSIRGRRDTVNISVPVETQGITPPTSSPPTARRILQRSKRGANSANQQTSMPHQYATRIQTVPATSHPEPSLSPGWKSGGFTTGRDLSSSSTSTMSTHQLTAETRIYDTYAYDASQSEIPYPPERTGPEGTVAPASGLGLSENLGGAYSYPTPGAYAPYLPETSVSAVGNIRPDPPASNSPVQQRRRHLSRPSQGQPLEHNYPYPSTHSNFPERDSTQQISPALFEPVQSHSTQHSHSSSHSTRPSTTQSAAHSTMHAGTTYATGAYYPTPAIEYHHPLPQPPQPSSPLRQPSVSVTGSMRYDPYGRPNLNSGYMVEEFLDPYAPVIDVVYPTTPAAPDKFPLFPPISQSLSLSHPHSPHSHNSIPSLSHPYTHSKSQSPAYPITRLSPIHTSSPSESSEPDKPQSPSLGNLGHQVGQGGRLPGQRVDPDRALLNDSFRGQDPDSLKRRTILNEIRNSTWFRDHEHEPQIAPNEHLSRGLGIIGRSIYTVFLAEENGQWRCLMGSRGHPCKKPNKQFPRLERAIEHVRSHLGHRPYACDGTCWKSKSAGTSCGKRFFAAGYLEDHKKRPQKRTHGAQ